MARWEKGRPMSKPSKRVRQVLETVAENNCTALQCVTVRVHLDEKKFERGDQVRVTVERLPRKGERK
jgi:hypothetical protein